MKPILFNTDMVRAILDGRKTVTRRVVKPQPIGDMHHIVDGTVCGYWMDGAGQPHRPFYQPGDLLYVRETWCPYDRDHIIDGIKYAYKANTTPESDRVRQEYGYKWRPSIHMPKQAARIFLRVTDVRAERLQDITVEDGAKDFGLEELAIKAAGIAPLASCLWNTTIKPAARALYGWTENPWVWAIEFERCEKPEVHL